MVGSSFTFTPVGTCVVYVNGTKYSKASPETVSIASDSTQHFVYFDASGVLQVSTSPWTLALTTAPVAIVYRYSGAYAISDERHGYNRDIDWHTWAHTAIGALWRSGFAGTFTNTTLSIEQGVVADEDIQADSGGTKTNCRLWYRQPGGAAMQFETATVPYKAPASVLQWDNAGTLTSLGTNKYMNVWFYASTDVGFPIYAVLGQATHDNQSAANAEAVPTIPGLTTREWKLIYRVTFQQTAGGIVYQTAADLRETRTGPVGTTTSGSHTLLSGRSELNQHPGSSISLDTTNFNKNLSAADTTVQLALETLDNLNTGGGGAAGPWTSWVGV
jgi:hypothetical protein